MFFDSRTVGFFFLARAYPYPGGGVASARVENGLPFSLPLFLWGEREEEGGMEMQIKLATALPSPSFPTLSVSSPPRFPNFLR